MKKIFVISAFLILIIFSLCYTSATDVSGCGTLSTLGGSYVLTQNIAASTAPCLVISANNIILNLNGFNLTGNSKNTGIYVSSDGVTIINGSISNFNWNGIYLDSSDNDLIANITLSGNGYNGMYTWNSHNNRFHNINSSNNIYRGIYLEQSSYNTFNGLITSSNTALNGFSGVLLWSNSNNNTFLNITSNGNYRGVYISPSVNNTFIDATLSSNYEGIYGESLNSSYFSNAFLDSNLYISGLNLVGVSESNFINITATNSLSNFLITGNNNNFSEIVSNHLRFGSTKGIEVIGSNNIFKNITSYNNSVTRSFYLSGYNNSLDWINITGDSCSYSDSNDNLMVLGSNNTLNNISLTRNTHGQGNIFGIYGSNNTLTNITTLSNGGIVSGSTTTSAIILLYGNNNYLQDVFMNNDSQHAGINIVSSLNKIFNFNSNYYKGLYSPIFLGDTGEDNTFNTGFINNTLGQDFDISGEGIFFKASSSNLDNNTFYDYTIINSKFKDLYFSTFYSMNITNQIFVNSTFSLNKVYYNNHSSTALGGIMNLIKKWYFDTNITNTFKLPLENVNMTAYDSNNSFLFSLLTNSTGNIPRQYLTEYTYDGSSATYKTPTTLITNESNYRLSTLVYNLTSVGNVFHNIILSPNLHVVLESPLNETTWQTPVKFNCSSYSTLTDLTNITLQIWNSSALYYNETKIVSGLSNSSNFSVDFTYDDTFKYNCLVYNNNSDYDFASNKTFYISLTSPAVTINSPLDNAYLNNHIFYINFTAIDSNGLDTCRLMNNKTVDWLVNYTWIKPTNATMNYTTLNLSDGGWDYNIGCNDTNNNVGWASTTKNYHLTVDTVNPNNTINSVSVTTGYQNVIVSSTQTDVNLANCSYSIFNSSGGIDGTNRNVSFTCNTNFIATVTKLGTFSLSASARDLANNENLTYTSFTINSAVPISTTSGEKTVYVNVTKTSCGDGICQKPNDAGLWEDFTTCQVDCKGLVGESLDDWIAMLFSNCFDKNADGTPNLNTKCFWTQQLFSIGGNLNQTNFVCGDGICNGNEFYSNCQEDCGTFQGLDSLLISCVNPSRTPTTTCYFSTNIGVYTLFGMLVSVFIVASIRVPSEGKGSKKVNLVRYVSYKTKNYRKRKRR